MYVNDGNFNYLGYLVPEFQNVSEFTLIDMIFKKVLSEIEYTDEILKFIRDYYYYSSSEERINLARFNLLLHKNKRLYGMGYVKGGRTLSSPNEFFELMTTSRMYLTITLHGCWTSNVNLVGVGKDTYFVKRTNQETDYKLDLSDNDIEVYTPNKNTFAKMSGTSSFSALLSKVSVNCEYLCVFTWRWYYIFVFADGSVHGLSAKTDFAKLWIRTLLSPNRDIF